MNRSAATTSEKDRKKKPGEGKDFASDDNEVLRERCLILAVNELLFGVGEAKTGLYRLKSGTVALYEPHSNGHRKNIEFAFPGDIIGLGFLEMHTCSARATVETSVQCLPLNAQDRLFEGDPRAQARLADAIEREITSCVNPV